LVFDENVGKIRASSAAFSNLPGKHMSVIIGDEAERQERGPEDIVKGAGRRGFSVKAFRAGLARELQQLLVRAPTRDEPAHAEVRGKKTKRVMRAFASRSCWVLRSFDAAALNELLKQSGLDKATGNRIRDAFRSQAEWA